MDNEPDYGEKPIRVVVVDFDMKFGSMIIFMLKLALAAIPAALMVFFFFAFVLGSLGRLFRALP